MLRRLICVSLLSLGWASASAGAAAGVLSEATINQQLTIEGRLELVGKNYFLDPRFVIVDEQGAETPVTTWAPLEIPPPPPNAPRLSPPRTMQTYLHRQLAVSGVHRIAVRGPNESRTIVPPGESYLDVEVVTEVATGTVLFRALHTTGSPAAERAGAADDQVKSEPKVRAERGGEHSRNADDRADSEEAARPTAAQPSQNPPPEEERR